MGVASPILDVELPRRADLRRADLHASTRSRLDGLLHVAAVSNREAKKLSSGGGRRNLMPSTRVYAGDPTISSLVGCPGLVFAMRFAVGFALA